ncbi:MAG: RnfABCDGE type electron transport complex subunit D [Planctomycetes bacterium]|nr:RnfABCDGE type electron transport complex subunit D [Planctomycetota bacterium]
MAQDATTPPDLAPAPALHVAPSPHFGTSGRSTRWMMYDVILALLPALGVGVYVFGLDALRVVAITIAACLATEWIFLTVRRRPTTLLDGSAVVTGLILAMSMPWTSPWWMAVIAGAVAVALGKMVFGGLGNNLFNPAMVGRAFVMICFTNEMTLWLMNGQTPPPHAVEAVSGATPLAGKMAFEWYNLFLGNVNGCIGETSAAALILGGLYLCLRRTAAWQIPAGVLGGALAVALIQWRVHPEAVITPATHMLGGGLIFGAFFIATDPVSSPVTVRGRWIFGLGMGVLVMLIRLLASFPEGMMFSVLIMNSIVPIINRYTIPVPVGGRTKAAA